MKLLAGLAASVLLTTQCLALTIHSRAIVGGSTLRKRTVAGNLTAATFVRRAFQSCESTPSSPSEKTLTCLSGLC